MKVTKRFAFRLSDLMAEKGVNTRQLERATGIPNQTISSWLTLKSGPDCKHLVILANYFACSIDYLVGRIEYE